VFDNPEFKIEWRVDNWQLTIDSWHPIAIGLIE
jgi:hypothetical protein